MAKVNRPFNKTKKFKEYQKEFNAKNYKQFAIRFNVTTDKKCIEKIESVVNKTDYIRNLIENDLNYEKKK